MQKMQTKRLLALDIKAIITGYNSDTPYDDGSFPAIIDEELPDVLANFKANGFNIVLTGVTNEGLNYYTHELTENGLHRHIDYYQPNLHDDADTMDSTLDKYMTQFGIDDKTTIYSFSDNEESIGSAYNNGFVNSTCVAEESAFVRELNNLVGILQFPEASSVSDLPKEPETTELLESPPLSDDPQLSVVPVPAGPSDTTPPSSQQTTLSTEMIETDLEVVLLDDAQEPDQTKTATPPPSPTGNTVVPEQQPFFPGRDGDTASVEDNATTGQQSGLEEVPLDDPQGADKKEPANTPPSPTTHARDNRDTAPSEDNTTPGQQPGLEVTPKERYQASNPYGEQPYRLFPSDSDVPAPTTNATVHTPLMIEHQVSPADQAQEQDGSTKCCQPRPGGCCIVS